MNHNSQLYIKNSSNISLNIEKPIKCNLKSNIQKHLIDYGSNKGIIFKDDYIVEHNYNTNISNFLKDLTN
jgi:hypothetical protein